MRVAWVSHGAGWHGRQGSVWHVCVWLALAGFCWLWLGRQGALVVSEGKAM